MTCRHNLKAGDTKSCGCLKRERLKEKHDARWHKNLPAIGHRFGRLVILRHERPWTYCRCDCGTEDFRVAKYSLINGRTRSCGCLSLETRRNNGRKNRKHGACGTLLWNRWCGMRRRCYDPKATSYHLYGARGIKVCDQWQGGHGFEQFRQDVGEPPTPQHSLDRIDPSKDYEPRNVRWATKKEQAQNRSNSFLITAYGKTQCLAAWAEKTSWSTSIIRHRLRMGQDPEQAVRPR